MSDYKRCSYEHAMKQACGPIPSSSIAECKQYFFDQDHPARGLEDKSRWMHVCRAARMVFAVLVGYSCPYCKEGQYNELADKMEELIVEAEATKRNDPF